MPYDDILLPIFYGEATAVSASDLTSITTAIGAQITVANIVGVLSAGITAVIGICFAWWGARKLAGMFMKAFKRGKLRI